MSTYDDHEDEDEYFEDEQPASPIHDAEGLLRRPHR